MSLKKELDDHCDAIFRTAWKRRKGTKVPEDTSLTYSNDGIDLEGAVLYADLAASTALVDKWIKPFAAEVYKTFLHVAGRIIRSEGGEITAYDGDRIMAVFIEGNQRRTAAVRAALKINYGVNEIVQKRLKAMYAHEDYVVSHTCGVDFSTLMVAKTGVRGANDLVWVGRAANYAAKLCSIPDNYRTWITAEVYDHMLAEAKVGGLYQSDMWIQRSWSDMGSQRIYCSNWHWGFV
ncbi:MAG TPA: adenylate/guanylate cyclase domain-containing protein [Sphingomonas sp.]|jgi:class 3 adenylate cyclase